MSLHHSTVGKHKTQTDVTKTGGDRLHTDGTQRGPSWQMNLSPLQTLYPPILSRPGIFFLFSLTKWLLSNKPGHGFQAAAPLYTVIQHSLCVVEYYLFISDSITAFVRCIYEQLYCCKSPWKPSCTLISPQRTTRSCSTETQPEVTLWM